MKKILFLISLLTSLLSAQPFQIKQITNLDADCRNLTRGGFEWGIPYFVFEAHTGNSSNIYLGQYLSNVDSFAVITKVTDDHFMNINPKLQYSNDSLFIIYQTNKNGNWDIAYQVYWSNQLSPVYFAADSSVDEINPVVPDRHDFSFSFPIQFVSYEKGNSVFIKDIHLPGLDETEVFHGDDSTKYSQATQEYVSYLFDYLLGVRKVVNGKSLIVYKELINDVWGNENILVSSENCRHPKIQDFVWGPSLSYTDDINGKSNIILIENFSQPIDTLKLFEYPFYNYDNFWTIAPLIITKKKDFNDNIPFTYTASRNDSQFIRVNKLNMVYGQSDTLLHTKVTNNHLYLGSFGLSGSYNIYYSIWEDSSSGNIQLFGKRYLYPIGGVNDVYSPSTFTLYQNYPNPFNPGTVIKFKLLHHNKVTLNIYDIIGRQVCTLLNEDKPAGDYTISFDPQKYNLSSGIYFYRLTTGKYSSVKKMILMK
jgi:hypothetical protein